MEKERKELLEKFLNEYNKGEAVLDDLSGSDFKPSEIIDAFIIKKDIVANLNKEYVKQYKKMAIKIKQPNQVLIYILGGKELLLDELQKFVDAIQPFVTANVMFGICVSKSYSGATQIATMFLKKDSTKAKDI